MYDSFNIISSRVLSLIVGIHARKHVLSIKNAVLLERQMLSSFFIFVSFALSKIDEVQNRTLIFQTHDPIFRFDVFVNVTSVMQNLDSVDHLKAQNEDSFERHFTSREFHELFQVGAEQLHDKVIVLALKAILKEFGESDIGWDSERIYH